MDLENILYKIVSGYYYINIENSLYKIIVPTISLKQQAHSVYLSTIEENKYDTDSWITESVIQNLLKIYFIWDDTKEQQFNQLFKDLDNAKIQLYLNYFNTQTKEQTKKLIKTINKTINDAHNQKNYFYYLTLDYYANNLKNQFLLSNCILDKNDNKVFDNLENIDTLFLEKFLYEINNNALGINDIRALAKSETWKSYWDSCKNNIFNKAGLELTDDQKLLLNISKMLDNIREHPECPSDDIINDDDALDGWILYQKEKIDKEKKKAIITDKLGTTIKPKNNKFDNANQEVFVVTSSKDEAKEIFSLNDQQTNKDIAIMSKLAQEKGLVKWNEVPHVKRDIQQKFNQMTKEKMRGK